MEVGQGGKISPMRWRRRIRAPSPRHSLACQPLDVALWRNQDPGSFAEMIIAAAAGAEVRR